MNIRRIFLSLLVCLSMPVAADFTTIERAYEVALSDLQVPPGSHGSLMFKACGECDSQTVPMARDVQFLVNGSSVGVKEFRKSVRNVRDRDAETVIVKHHLESDTITSLSVYL